MSDELANLIRAARQMLENELMLGGNFLARRGGQLPQFATAAAVSAPSQGTSASVVSAAMSMSAAARPGAAGGRAAGKAKVAGLDIPPLSAEDLPQTAQAKASALADLYEQASKCLACQLARTRTKLVFGEGNPAAQIVFVGEAPGEDEDLSGRPFVGRAGQKLGDMIVAMGLTREQVYICNVLKCRPPDNRPPAPEEIAVCWPLLIRQLQIIRPKCIVTLGNPATQNLLRTTVGITKLRGQWQKLPDWAPGLADLPVMPTFHPSYLIRSYTVENRRMVWSDLQKAMDLLGISKP